METTNRQLKHIPLLAESCSDTAEKYAPDPEEARQLEEIEKMQDECQHKNFNDEDGCLDCGYYSK